MSADPAFVIPSLDEAALMHAWDQTRHREKVNPQGSATPTAEFNQHTARAITHLATAITAGTYRPDPLSSHRARKRTGGTRRLIKPPHTTGSSNERS